jgi:hypothetical protein
MKNSILTFLLIASSIRIAPAQDTALIKYLPLQIGNVWVYYGSYSYPFGQGTYYDRYKLTGTILSGGHIYFTFNHVRVQLTGNISGPDLKLFRGGNPIRIDSTTINVYKNEICNASLFLVDSLRSRLHDTSTACSIPENREVCSDTSFYSICGANRKSKTFVTVVLQVGEGQTYVKDIGIVAGGMFTKVEHANYILRGAVLNGTLCGDTSLTGIIPISNEIPENFKLYQNYPNAFNPITKIKFDLQNLQYAADNIQLVIYDVLGCEISILVNEKLKPGTYEVEWDATNIPSGVYYYTLSIGNFIESKKMVLIK